MIDQDTICAIATPPGRGGIGIVRLSGAMAHQIGQTISQVDLQPRQAHLARFHDENDIIIDEGVILYFAAPRSFTGEDIIELQGHGGPVVMDMLLQRCLQLGARLARAGEFSERAYLNGKLDLTQAEAIADLIDSETQAAARLSIRSLQGEFSRRIQQLLDKLIQLRMYVEAAIDFPEEEIDFLSDGHIEQGLDNLIQEITALQQSAHHGRVMREGMTIVIAGRPNAGKSSLLNALTHNDSAIVTDTPGTTRDALHEHIQIDGMPLHLIDTAGLRASQDLIEQLGIKRTHEAIQQADRILWVYDGRHHQSTIDTEIDAIPTDAPISYIHNKADLSGAPIRIQQEADRTTLFISAKQNLGIHLLREHLKQCMGLNPSTEGGFIARRRHLNVIERTLNHLLNGQKALINGLAGELLAEDLRQAQMTLAEITGEFHADDLLGEIFGSFCIGK